MPLSYNTWKTLVFMRVLTPPSAEGYTYQRIVSADM